MKTENKRTFHDGNGWNYRVMITKDKNTIIQRYHTNGYINTDGDTWAIHKEEMPNNHFEADLLYTYALQNGEKTNGYYFN